MEKKRIRAASPSLDPVDLAERRRLFPITAKCICLDTASLGFLLDIGIDRIAERILDLIATGIGDLQSRGFTILSSVEERHRSGLLVIEIPDPQAAYDKLLSAKVVTSPRGQGLRLSPCFFNTEEEVQGWRGPGPSVGRGVPAAAETFGFSEVLRKRLSLPLSAQQ